MGSLEEEDKRKSLEDEVVRLRKALEWLRDNLHLMRCLPGRERDLLMLLDYVDSTLESNE